MYSLLKMQLGIPPRCHFNYTFLFKLTKRIEIFFCSTKVQNYRVTLNKEFSAVFLQYFQDHTFTNTKFSPISILTEKKQKYQHYHHVKLINMNILQVNKYYLLIDERISEIQNMLKVKWSKTFISFKSPDVF